MNRIPKDENPFRGPNRTMLRRTLFLAAVCGVLAFAVLAVRLYVLQIRDHELYEGLALSQQLRTTGTSAVRGTIYDRNMNVLRKTGNCGKRKRLYLSEGSADMHMRL